MKLLIMHSSYGCDSGCCGHRVETEDGDPRKFSFEFTHANGQSDGDKRALAIEMVGEENLADVDFERSEIYDWRRC